MVVVLLAKTRCQVARRALYAFVRQCHVSRCCAPYQLQAYRVGLMVSVSAPQVVTTMLLLLQGYAVEVTRIACLVKSMATLIMFRGILYVEGYCTEL